VAGARFALIGPGRLGTIDLETRVLICRMRTGEGKNVTHSRVSLLATAILLMLPLVAVAGDYAFVFNVCAVCGGTWLGVWSDATDGYDADLDVVAVHCYGSGNAMTYHVNGQDGWAGPTGFYVVDARAPLAPNESKTFAPLYVWVGPTYTEPTMTLEVYADDVLIPPADRTYTLELLYVPPGITGAPPVHTVWTLPLSGTFYLPLPAWRTEDGLTGYQFALHFSAADICYGQQRGDANCDGEVTFADIDYFVVALGGRSDWEELYRDQHGGADPPKDYLCVNDTNSDGEVTFADIDSFVALLGGEEAP
jgi:hypothetical protein